MPNVTFYDLSGYRVMVKTGYTVCVKCAEVILQGWVRLLIAEFLILAAALAVVAVIMSEIWNARLDATTLIRFGYWGGGTALVYIGFATWIAASAKARGAGRPIQGVAFQAMETPNHWVMLAALGGAVFLPLGWLDADAKEFASVGLAVITTVFGVLLWTFAGWQIHSFLRDKAKAIEYQGDPRSASATPKPARCPSCHLEMRPYTVLHYCLYCGSNQVDPPANSDSLAFCRACRKYLVIREASANPARPLAYCGHCGSKLSVSGS